MRLHWNHWTTVFFFFFFFFAATTTLCAAQEDNNNNNSTQEDDAQAKLQRALALVQQMPSCAVSTSKMSREEANWKNKKKFNPDEKKTLIFFLANVFGPSSCGFRGHSGKYRHRC